MTEFQELMLYTCFGAVTGAFIGELIIIIATAVSWAWEIRKRKEVKKSATKVD